MMGTGATAYAGGALRKQLPQPVNKLLRQHCDCASQTCDHVEAALPASNTTAIIFRVFITRSSTGADRRSGMPDTFNNTPA
jgi:hypothetical protein